MIEDYDYIEPWLAHIDGELVLYFDNAIVAKFDKKTKQLVWLNPANMGEWRQAI